MKWFLCKPIIARWSPRSLQLYTVVLFSLLAPSASQEANTTLPLTYRARAAEGGEQVCSPDELHQRLQAIAHNE